MGEVSGQRIRIFVVDDHPVVTHGFPGVLADEHATDIAIIGTANSVEAAFAAIEAQLPDVVVSDMMFGRQPRGLDLLGSIRALPRPPAVLFYSGFPAPSFVAKALESGAAGYISKEEPDSILIEAIRKAAAGRRAFDPPMMAAARHAAQPPSERELEVIRLVAAGRSNDEIGMALSVTTRTVEGVLRRIYQRYELGGARHLAAFALEQGWLLGDHLPSVAPPDGAPRRRPMPSRRMDDRGRGGRR
jgi:DNA-binding NarL/FixJ family response regulator